MSKVAYEPRANLAGGDFAGGVVSLPGGDSYDVGKAFEGTSKLVLDLSKKRDAEIAGALDAFPGVKQVAAASGGKGGS